MQRIRFLGGKKRIGRVLKEQKQLLTPPAFGTRVPERTFCVLHFDPGKVSDEKGHSMTGHPLVSQIQSAFFEVFESTGDPCVR